MPALTLALLAVSGVVNPIARFAPVPEPAGVRDPCHDRGPVGHWVKMSVDGAPASIHRAGWLDSATIWTGARLVVATRRDGKWNGTAFDPCANTWAPIPETGALARSEPWPSEDHDRPFQPLHRDGYASDGFDKISVWDTARKAWVVVSVAAPLAPRSHYAVALADRRLFVWGGWGQTMQALGDGAVLDLSRKSWKKMSATGAPSPRLEPTAAVWTGSRLLVWGGRIGTSDPNTVRVLGDGAQYDPEADRWSPMSAVDAPSPRTEATVVWTGRRLVVVGGAPRVSGQPLRDGGIYDPAADRWTPLGAPPGGLLLPKENVGPLTRILVAPDGRVVFLPDNLGAIAVLDADHAAWTIVDVADGPAKRNSFRAFLLGRRLVVWGGQTVIAEHLCPPPVPNMPLCDPWAETAARDDGWMIVLPPATERQK